MRRATGTGFRLLLTLALPLALLGAAPEARKPVVGEMAPDAEVILIDGSRVRLSELRGQVVILNFWATWCAPCRTELPLLDKVQKLKRENGLRIFAIATEDSVPRHKLRPLFETLTMAPARRISGPYDTIGNAVPTNYIIDRAGRLRYAEAAAFDLDAINEYVIPLLREPAPPAN